MNFLTNIVVDGTVSSSIVPSAGDHLTNKTYVDGLVGNYLPLTGGTMSGDITIAKPYGKIVFNDNIQGVQIRSNIYDGELPESGYGFLVEPSSTNTQFPTTGTLSFTVLGKMFTGGTDVASVHEVLHGGNFVAGTDYQIPQTTLGGYGITDAYTKTQIDSGLNIAYTNVVNVFSEINYFRASAASQLYLRRGTGAATNVNTSMVFEQALGNAYIGVNASGDFSFNTSGDLTIPKFKVDRSGTAFFAGNVTANGVLLTGDQDLTNIANVAYTNKQNSFVETQIIYSDINERALFLRESVTTSRTLNLYPSFDTGYALISSAYDLRLRSGDMVERANIYIEPKGAGKVYNVGELDVSGSQTINGNITLTSGGARQISIGTGTKIRDNNLGATVISQNVGTIYLRPNGDGSTSGEATLNTDGDFNIKGNYKISGVDINTAGTLTNIAYLNQANTFTSPQVFSASEQTSTLTILGGKANAGLDEVQASLDFNSNDGSVFGDVGARIHAISEISNASHIGLGFHTYDQVIGLQEHMRLDWRGYLSIGKTNPTEALDVAGNGLFSGTITATGGNSTQWNTAYGWGNHALAGYLTSYSETDTLQSVISRNAVATSEADFRGGLQTKGYRLKRNTTSTDGDDIMDAYMDDNGVFYDLDNSNDTGAGQSLFRWRFKNTDTSWSALLTMSNSIFTYKGNTIYHTGNFVAGTDYQTPITNPITGSGTTNYIPKFTASGTIGNGLIYDNGTNVGIGTTSPAQALDVAGNALITGVPIGYSQGEQSRAQLHVAADQRAFFKVKNTNTNPTAGARRAGIDLDVADSQNGSNRARSWFELTAFTSTGGGGNTNINVPGDFRIRVNNRSQLTVSEGAYPNSGAEPGDIAMYIGVDKAVRFYNTVAADDGVFNKPATFWTNESYFGLDGLGQVSTEGSYHMCITSNGYRNTSGTWTSHAINGNTGASQIALSPDGNIYFRVDPTKSNGSSSTPSTKLTLSVDGLTATGYVIGSSTNNTGTSVENTKVDGYGMIGNRSAMYITNQHATGFLQFAVGGIHGSGTNKIKFSATGMRVGDNTTATQMLDVLGNGIFSGSVTATDFIGSSDRRLKNKIEDYIPKQIDVRWRKYERIETGEVEIGVIADELEQTHPEFVVKGKTAEDMDAVRYTKLLIAKVAEQEARIKRLEQLIENIL